MAWPMEILKIYQEEQFLMKYYVISQLIEQHMVRKLAYSANQCYCMILIGRPCTHRVLNVIKKKK